MKRTLWLIVGAAAVGAAVLPLRDRHERVALANPPAERLPDVRVRHEFVSIPIASRVTESERRRTSNARASLAPPADVEPAADERGATTVQMRTAERAAGEDEGFFDRARRAFVGDGRYRPQPFPRPRDNN
jgi:hypothetical protein